MRPNDIERLDLRSLLELYMEESREFSTALSRGASWEELKNRRQIIKYINACIKHKYTENYDTSRRRDQPPHGD
jgi:hypothetical protein